MPDLDRSLSDLSIHSQDSRHSEDDWDRSLVLPDSVGDPPAPGTVTAITSTTPRNSVVFPAEDTPSRSTRYSSKTGSGAHSKEPSVDGRREGKRTLSELLRLHSEKGSNGQFSAEEASRIADVLGQWINASSSPYEGEDDFFRSQPVSQDDINLSASASSLLARRLDGRPRGRSESSSNSRPPSALGTTTA